MLGPTELFKNIFIIKAKGAGFGKPADVRYSTLRFPRLQKIHEDRTFAETGSVSFKAFVGIQNRFAGIYGLLCR